MLNLGNITNLQKMAGVKIVAKDSNNNIVANFGTPTFTTDIAGVTFANIAPTADLPVDSTFTFDIVANPPSSGSPPVGLITITITGVQGNFKPTFSTQFQIGVIMDPSLSGPPVSWDITPGTVVPQ